MKTVKVLKKGVVSDFYGKQYDLEKVTIWDAEHLIREGCKDLEIVESEPNTVIISQNTEGVHYTEGGKVKVPTILTPSK
jgi:hypothetical protein